MLQHRPRRARGLTDFICRAPSGRRPRKPARAFGPEGVCLNPPTGSAIYPRRWLRSRHACGSPSSRGPGRRPLTAQTGVRIPQGTPTEPMSGLGTSGATADRITGRAVAVGPVSKDAAASDDVDDAIALPVVDLDHAAKDDRRHRSLTAAEGDRFAPALVRFARQAACTRRGSASACRREPPPRTMRLRPHVVCPRSRTY